MSEMVEMAELLDRPDKIEVAVDSVDVPDEAEDPRNNSLLSGRKRQRSGSVTPEEGNVMNIVDNSRPYDEEASGSAGCEDRAALLLRVYLKMKLGKLVEEQQLQHHQKRQSDHSGDNSDDNSASGEGGDGGEPPTPPHTPQREFLARVEKMQPERACYVPRVSHFQHLDLQQQALHARMVGRDSFSTLLTLAALQENGNNAAAAASAASAGVAAAAAAAAAAAVSAANSTGCVPLPPSLDPHRSLPATPTTPTSTAVTPGLAGLSLTGQGSAAGMSLPRDPLAKTSVDYTRYVKRFSSALECGAPACRELNQSREHFHCLECTNKIFSKKEEMIRHFKWHKKRDESLQHGFMRYSPTDDCSDRFAACSHNRKQTHYHCLKGCDKVYISTSDVQMHANYHRKDSAIMQEGFQRFRASEDCAQVDCTYSGQRTTHFHCMRDNCNFTFKNKADMEKHKTYHVKDEQLTKDGFKKFMKQEDCPFDGCKFSRVVNHIHCIRPDCNYVLHSSNQIFAHKRKHERQDHDQNYRRYRLAQTMLGIHDTHPALNPLLHEALRPMTGLPPPMLSMGQELRSDDSSSPTVTQTIGVPPANPMQRPSPFLMGGFPPPTVMDPNHPLARFLGVIPPTSHPYFPGGSAASSTSTPTSSSGPSSPVDLTTVTDDKTWQRYMCLVGRDDPCHCEAAGTEHWHCEDCDLVYSSLDIAKDHGRAHEQLALVTEEQFHRVMPGDLTRPCPHHCPLQDRSEHFHCKMDGCSELFTLSDKSFRRLEHSRMHDYARQMTHALPASSPSTHVYSGVASVTSIDSMFKRKRGRPPKNRIVEVWNDCLPGSSNHDTPPAIFTSFKLPKSSPPPHCLSSHLPTSMSGPPHSMITSLGNVATTPLAHLAQLGREMAESPPTPTAVTASSSGNSSGLQSPRPSLNMLPLTGMIVCNPPQPQGEEIDGFTFWQEGSPCPDQLCPLLSRRHYHCSHPRCLYVTSSVEVLPLHTRNYHETTHIPEGFLSIDKGIDCRLPSCQSNQVLKHFHCTRCGYSFVNYQALEPHHDKHLQEDQDSALSSSMEQPFTSKARSHSPMEAPPACSLSASESPLKSQDLSPPVVKSSGIFYPLSPFPNLPQGGARTSTPRSEPGALVMAIPPSSTRSYTLPSFTLPVSSSFTITSSPRISQVPPSTPPLLSDNSGESPSMVKVSMHLTQSSSHNNSEENADSSCGQNNESCGGDSFNPTTITPEKLLPEHHPQYSGEILCGRPFCKLKKREHYHCQLCNQAFSEQEKLGPHLQKHMSGSGFVGKEEEEEEEAMESDDDRPSHSPNNISDRPPSPKSPEISSSQTCHPPPFSIGISSSQASQFPNAHMYTQAGFPGLPSPFAHPLGMAGLFPPGSLPRLLPPSVWPGVHPALAAMAHPALMMGVPRPPAHLPPLPTSEAQSGLGPPGMAHPSSLSSPRDMGTLLPPSLGTSPHLALLGKRVGTDDFAAQESKKIRPSCQSVRMMKDEPVPEGYYRFRFNEDCQYPHCGYREHQTHFHCMRKDCGYSFCDKTRFVQHTARHDRLDTLMGGDFQQYRSNVSCGRSDCIYASMVGRQQNKASHFHCMKCDFVCTDTNKVVAHRRQHQKRDSINAAGFEKFTPSQPCGVQGCNHNQKQTHYHCLKCNYSVLGLSQMSAHKFRHLD
ncbi:zinc finger protein castor homolog 1 isoform X3 [Hyalella azteca]|uniref:Zinc finger protein castor homolog 1 isoform X3 n=1 Tax=Hyalella azteca TaxID=294128 RepID=A0A8B7N4I8_HYAAZ|nr:zinc finger protein castor homolog 1 isoform X3 [Hyalella azteca]